MADPMPTGNSQPAVAIGSIDAEIQRFETILACPVASDMRELMLSLTWDEFERFVRYVFECAGFTVEHVGSDHTRHHVDLRLYDGPIGRGRPVALVEVRHYHSATLKHQTVAAFAGNLLIAGVKRGYLVTTTTFTSPAKLAASQAKERGFEVCLTDWRHLARYLTYLRGSRITEQDGRKRAPRPTPPDWLHIADATPRRAPHQTAILAISNNKGGVAKTTSALNLALALVAKGKRVLLVDLDGQASLTLALPPLAVKPGRPIPRERTIVDFFAGRAHLAELVRPTRRERLWLLPGDGELYTRDKGGGADPEAELGFVRALHTLDLPTPILGAGRFDWIILDTPPAQSSYTRAALAAAHGIVLPAIIEPFAVRSINRLLQTSQTMHGLMGRDGRVFGCFGVRWPRRPSKQQLRDLAVFQENLAIREADRLGSVDLLSTLIPEDNRIAQANQKMIHGGIAGIFAYKSSRAGQAYLALLHEVEERMRQ